MACKSSIGSVSCGLARAGLLREEKRVRIVTLPAASITANSEPVGLQHRCFKRPSSVEVVSGGIGVGSLRAQVPFSGLQRRFLSSNAAPLGVIDAILPHFDQAMPLLKVSSGEW